jgi:hypothetical protein
VKLLVTTAAIVLVGLAVIVINAVASSQEPDKRVAVGTGTTTSTTHKATTTTRSTSTTTSSTTTTTTVPVVVPVTVPPTTPPTVPPTSTTTIPVTVTFTLAPNDAATPYIMGLGGVTLPPVLTWAVTGLAKVHVYDNAKVFDSTKPSSQVIVCPNPGDTTQCNAPAGTYTYTLDAYDSNNVLVLHRTLTLTLTGP